jgi:hypothetical protein
MLGELTIPSSCTRRNSFMYDIVTVTRLFDETRKERSCLQRREFSKMSLIDGKKPCNYCAKEQSMIAIILRTILFVNAGRKYWRTCWKFRLQAPES